MADEKKVSDAILAHLKSMTPEAARVYLERLASDAVEVAVTRQSELDEFGRSLAGLSLADLEAKMSELKPGSAEWRRAKDAHMDALTLAQMASQPAINPVKVAIRDKTASELSAELERLSANPTKNYQRIREISDELKRTLQVDVRGNV